MARFKLAVVGVLGGAWFLGSAGATPPLEAYGKLPAMDAVTLSPSGQHYAFVAGDGEARNLYVATIGNQVISQVRVGQAKIVDIDWAGDDFVLLNVLSTTDLGVDFSARKAELGTVITLDLKKNKIDQVFGPKQNKVANAVVGSYGLRQVDGKWSGFFGGYTIETFRGTSQFRMIENRLVEDLYRFDLDTGAFGFADKATSADSTWLVDQNGEPAARLSFIGDSGKWRLTTVNPDKQVLTGSAPTGGVGMRGLGRSPDEVLFYARDRAVFEIISLTDGAVKQSIPDEEQHFLFDRNTHLWIGTLEDEGSKFQLFNPLSQKKAQAAMRAFPGLSASLVGFSGDFNRMIVFTDAGDDSGTFWTVDITKGSADQIGRAYPDIQPADVGPTRWFDYKAADGLAMRGVLTLPPGKDPKALPLVVMPHGGPASQDWIQFDYWAQAFASRGYAVFQPNFRGSTGSGQAFVEAGYGEWGRKMQSDISDGVAALAREGIVDSKRACIVGASYGGYAALAGVTLQQGLYRCAVSFGGVADPSSHLAYVLRRGGGTSIGSRQFRQMLGTDVGVRLSQISPAEQAARADAPILLIHGQSDTVVLPEQSAKMNAALRRAGKPVEMVSLPDVDHWLLKQPGRIAMVKATVEFVLKHNPPDPPAP